MKAFATIQPVQEQQQHTTAAIHAAILARHYQLQDSDKDEDFLCHEVVNTAPAGERANWVAIFHYTDRREEVSQARERNLDRKIIKYSKEYI